MFNEVALKHGIDHVMEFIEGDNLNNEELKE